MSFVIGKVQTVKRKVSFEDFSDDSKKVKADFIVELRVQDSETTNQRRKDINKFLADLNRESKKAEKNDEYQPEYPETSFDDIFLDEDVVGIEGLKDASGNDVEFSSEALESVKQHRRAKSALMKVWNELNFEDGAKRKN